MDIGNNICCMHYFVGNLYRKTVERLESGRQISLDKQELASLLTGSRAQGKPDASNSIDTTQRVKIKKIATNCPSPA